MYPLYPILVLSSPSPETVTFPPYMHQFQGTWCLQCGSEGWLYANTEVVNEKFLMKAALDALKVSGSVLCGLLCSYMHVHVQIPWGALIRQDCALSWAAIATKSLSGRRWLEQVSK